MIIGIPHVSLYKACCHHCPCITINGLQHLCDMAVDEEIHVELVFRSQLEDEFERKADRETQVHDSYLFMALLHRQIVYMSCENDRKEKHGITDLIPPFPSPFLLNYSPLLELLIEATFLAMRRGSQQVDEPSWLRCVGLL